MMDVQAASELQGQLAPGEHILWAGRPLKGVKFRPFDWLLVPFTLLWGGFAVFWEYTAIINGPVFFAFFGVPFVAAGLFFIIGRFFWDARVRAGQTYAVTDSRVLIKNTFPRVWIQSFHLRNLPAIGFTEAGDRSGTISFFQNQLVPAFCGGPNGLGFWSPLQEGNRFEFITNASKVHNLILDAQKRAAA